MKNKWISITAILILAAFVAVGCIVSAPTPAPVAPSAQSAGGGIVSRLNQQLVFASTSYTESQTATSTGVDIGPYGSVQVHTSFATTGTQSIVVTPQFSNDTANCTATTAWVSASDYLLYPAQSRTQTIVANSDGTITTTVTLTSTTTDTTGSVTYGSVSLATTVTTSGGAGSELREIAALGRCFRLSITANGTFTPTAYARALNRQ